MKRPEDSWLMNRPIAHRGLHDGSLPENSIPAFLAAADRGYPIELDVRLSSDGFAVVFHDFNTLRMTGTSLNVSDTKAADLTSLKLSGTEYRIPLLTQVLPAVGGRVPLLIEIKNEGNPGKLEEVLCSIVQNYKGEFAIQSFNPFSLTSVKKACPGFKTGLLHMSFQNICIIRKLRIYTCLIKLYLKLDFMAFNIDSLPSKIAERARSKKMPVLCWTVTDEKDRKKALRYCDNYIFEIIRP